VEDERMKKTLITSSLVLLVSAPTLVMAAPPADWSSVAATEITVFYPGVSPMEWITGDLRIDRVRHGGGRAFNQGDTCADCHSDEAHEMGNRIVSGEKLEPTPIAGKAGFVPVTVQATHDGEMLYLKFSWQQPAASQGAKMDEANPMKIAYMLDAGKVEGAERSGCWASCHAESRTMPDGAEDKTKYVKDGSLASGIYYDLAQWRSGENKAYNGYVADKRVMEVGSALQSAEGKLEGDKWTVVFTRALAGGEGDVTLEAGNKYNFGFAIHDGHTAGRFHYVSLGYSLGLDSAADITATKQ